MDRLITSYRDEYEAKTITQLDSPKIGRDPEGIKAERNDNYKITTNPLTQLPFALSNTTSQKTSVTNTPAIPY